MPLFCRCEGVSPKQSPAVRACFVALWAPRHDGWCDVYKINRPSRLRWAIWFDFFICPLAMLRPTMHSIVIVIIIVIIGEAVLEYHDAAL